VLAAVAAGGFGAWLSAAKTSLGIADRRVATVAEDIYAWAERYNLIDNVSTVAELCSGDETRSASFHGLPPAVVVAALRALEADGRAGIIEGASVEEVGVKFFRRVA
jgi:hypothetical protein